MPGPRCRHGNLICEQCVTPSDSAKRFSDNVNALITFHQPWEIRKHWLAVRLEDGGYDGTIYDTRADAIRHQADERLCCYFPMGNFMNGLSPLDAQLLLDVQRHAYDSGIRVTDEKDPDAFINNAFADMMRAYQMSGSNGLSN